MYDRFALTSLRLFVIRQTSIERRSKKTSFSLNTPARERRRSDCRLFTGISTSGQPENELDNSRSTSSKEPVETVRSIGTRTGTVVVIVNHGRAYLRGTAVYLPPAIVDISTREGPISENDELRAPGGWLRSRDNSLCARGRVLSGLTGPVIVPYR